MHLYLTSGSESRKYRLQVPPKLNHTASTKSPMATAHQSVERAWPRPNERLAVTLNFCCAARRHHAYRGAWRSPSRSVVRILVPRASRAAMQIDLAPSALRRQRFGMVRSGRDGLPRFPVVVFFGGKRGLAEPSTSGHPASWRLTAEPFSHTV